MYHCGNTTLFSDMKLLGERYRPLWPSTIDHRFMMGPAFASQAAEAIRFPVAAPAHDQTWAILVQNASSSGQRGSTYEGIGPEEVWQLSPRPGGA